MNPEVRFAQEIADVGAKGNVLQVVATVLEEPYAVYGPDGMFMETMAQRVFEATLSRHSQSIPLLVNHDKDSLGVARALTWENTGTRLLATYEFGARDEARNVRQAVEDGAFGGVSTSFMPRRSTWSKDRSEVRRNDARLLELSLVTIPANADHEILALRQMFDKVNEGPPPPLRTPEIDAARRRLDDIRARTVYNV
jgi:HK97 family phage prohead protease